MHVVNFFIWRQINLVVFALAFLKKLMSYFLKGKFLFLKREGRVSG
jgi:hypothetical protein